ncbi:ribosomal protein l2 [Cystoisospora suis]|uniref:Ribosomal protein l2 n=1 Tax=Cystoisospora suis TaxID=483139 RepID=A0A2C6L8B7_9APIC|nr:ribosomal protein l2 [Cystoisospora suis]
MELLAHLRMARSVLGEAHVCRRTVYYGTCAPPPSFRNHLPSSQEASSSSFCPVTPSSRSAFRANSCLSPASSSPRLDAANNCRFCSSSLSAASLSLPPSCHPRSSSRRSTGGPRSLVVVGVRNGGTPYGPACLSVPCECVTKHAVWPSPSVSPARFPGPHLLPSLHSSTTAGVTITRLRPALHAPCCYFSSSYLPKASIRRNRIPFQLFATPRVSRLSEVSKFNREAAQATARISHMSSPFTLQKQQRLLSLLSTQPINFTPGSASTRSGIPGVCGLAKFHPSSPPDKSSTFRGRVLPQLSTHRVQHLGRNATGQITVRYRGAGHFRRIRFVDFKRGRKDIFATVLRLEYDPCRSAHLALLQYDDGVLSYILASEATRPGDRVVASEHAAIAPGNALPLRSIPVSTIVYNVELRPGAGGQMIRAAGCYATVIAKDSACATLRLQSTEVRRVPLSCWAVIGQVSNAGQAGRIRGKAGVSYWMGERPRTRGKAMNAVDHPHGGGTGKKGLKRPPVTKWGILCRGYKTRSKKKPLGLIVRRKRPNKLIKKFGELGA